MTLCMAYTDGETTWIGADEAQGNDYGFRWPSVAQKWKAMHGWMIASSGDASIELAVSDVAQRVSPQDAASPQKVVEAIYSAYVDRGYKPRDHAGELPYYGSPLILAKPGAVFYGSAQNMAVATPAGRWTCIGCADEIAYGALDALTAVRVVPLNAMRVAIDIAHRYYPMIDGFWSAVLTQQETSEARH